MAFERGNDSKQAGCRGQLSWKQVMAPYIAPVEYLSGCLCHALRYQCELLFINARHPR